MALAKDETLTRDTKRDFDAIEVYGHSWTTPAKVVQAAGWWAMLANSLGVTAFRRGLDGTRITQANNGMGGWDRVLSQHNRRATAVPLRRLAILMHGLNDAGYDVSASLFTTVMRTIIRRLQASAVLEETDASIAYGGSWSSTSSNQCSGGAYTKATATGVTVTITVPSWVPNGSTVVLRSTHDTAAASPFAATNGGTYSVNKNGALQAAWAVNSAGALGTTALPDSYEITAKSGDVIVLNATNVTTEIRFDGYDVIPPTPQQVLVALPGRARPGGSSTYVGANPALTQTSFESNVVALHAALGTLCATLGVPTFDLDRALNREVEFFQLDQLHPNAAAQPAIARAALDALGLTARRELNTPAAYGEDLIQAAQVPRTANVVQSAGSSVNGTSGFSKVRRSTWLFNVTAVSGTSPSMTLRIVGYQPYEGTWHTVATSAAITATGKYSITVDGGTPDYLAVEADITGTSPSFTYNVIETHQGLPA